ncbi:MAG: hypothetical protein Q4C59_10690 [Lachnospiraceae bacterium]|nr:hypothetical protein [Lachnospiraceae bacterium]
MAGREHLNIDYKKHVEYLPSTKRVLKGRLEERFGREQGGYCGRRQRESMRSL